MINIYPDKNEVKILAKRENFRLLPADRFFRVFEKSIYGNLCIKKIVNFLSSICVLRNFGKDRMIRRLNVRQNLRQLAC